MFMSESGNIGSDSHLVRAAFRRAPEPGCRCSGHRTGSPRRRHRRPTASVARVRWPPSAPQPAGCTCRTAAHAPNATLVAVGMSACAVRVGYLLSALWSWHTTTTWNTARYAREMGTLIRRSWTTMAELVCWFTYPIDTESPTIRTFFSVVE
jgi:hypothetical protein